MNRRNNDDTDVNIGKDEIGMNIGTGDERDNMRYEQKKS